jgi:hypothetical protein
MTRWLILGALLLSAAGCGTRYAAISPTASPSGARLLTFSRGNGFVMSGYKLVLFDDGDLEYQAQGKTRGWDEVSIAPPAMAKVRSILERLSALSPDCCNCRGATDLGSTIMTFRPAGGTDVKTIDHYDGCNKTPDWVYDAENAIQEALETERWTGKKVVAKPYHPHEQGQP